MMNLTTATVDSLHLPALAKKNIYADVLRLDKIHEVVSGNKWFKLKYYLEETAKARCNTILTFGGAYSNHIIATACAAQTFGLKSIGVIRGERPSMPSHTLLFAEKYGMELEFINRNEYRKKNEKDFLNRLQIKFPGCYIVPEGGAGKLGAKGSREILQLTDHEKYSHVICAVGTGTTFAGLTNALTAAQNMIGICILKGAKHILNDLKTLSDPPAQSARLEIIHDYHFGGYAKKNKELFTFMNAFYEQTGIPSDFVYTGKLFYAVLSLIEKNYFARGSRLLIIHSGGLQGNKSLATGTLCF
ncbi:MAG: pyridoxal-phosphate dependent enzyme [Bacteroidetes bacterium]|nr:pyridoxal-phosphate dependent enzyme [Bacteroidota bacterium]MBS1972988.1 pyridoxal-phosphate dependent enzyme [Bacteroidota bacterium]